MSFIESEPASGSDTAEELPSIDLQKAAYKDRPPPVHSMVRSAIEANSNRKGATVQAIRKWVISNHPEVDQNRLKGRLKVTLEKGLQSGEFLRPKNSSEVTSVLIGRYKLGKAPKKSKAAKKVADGKKRMKKKAQKMVENGDRMENGEESDEGPSMTPPRRQQAKKTKAARRAHSLSPKVRQSKSKKLRRSISLTPGKPVPRKTKPVAKKKPKSKEPVENKPSAKQKAKHKSSKKTAKDDEGTAKQKPGKEKKAKAAAAKDKAETKGKKKTNTKAKDDKSKSKEKTKSKE